MEPEIKKVKRCAEISRGFSARIEEMRKTLNNLNSLFEELATSKVMMEERCEKFEKEKGDLAENNLRLMEMNNELKKREEAEKVTVSQLEKLLVIVEERCEELEKEKGDLSKENLRLKKEAEMWMETNEELKKLVEAEKARVLELECKNEIEEGLRVRAEVDFEASENRFKELVLGISMLDKRSNMLMNAVQVQPDSTRLNPAVNLNGSSSHTPHTRDETESKEAVAKPAAPINKKEATHDIRGSGSVIYILSDSDDDASQLSLRLKRKRVRSMSKENSFKNDDEYIVVGLPKLGASATADPRHSKRSINPPAKLADYIK
ncbi:hypothetical protein QQ045_010740 [Rhodiola kirilowii]